jgi:flagellar basal-body rod protein FlgC
MDLKTSVNIAHSGMIAQRARMKVIAENIANADSTASAPGQEPYRRKTITFKSELDNVTGADKVVVSRIGKDRKNPLKEIYDPTHPAANEQGYVQKPNVETIIEIADMKEAQKSYEANLATIDITKGMIARTLELLR